MLDEELLPIRAQYSFLALVCDIMPIANMAEVSLVGTRLRELFCQNSTSQDTSNDGNDVIKGREHTTISSQEINCVSPVSVVRCPQMDRNEGYCARCA